MQPIIDFHCDLLSFLAGDESRTLNDLELGCALPHMKAGGVKVQVCAIYTDVVPDSPQRALNQAQIFKDLPKAYPGEIVHHHALSNWEEAATRDEITVIASIESATGLANHDQPIAEAISNLDKLIALTGPIAYIGITHHKANRFGGGNNEPGPLTADGKVLIDAMAERGIPLCLSHTSDALAETALEYIDAKGYDLPVLASHSNYRAICSEVRNLPDHLAKSVLARGGVIGLNLLRKYLDPDKASGLYEHIDYARELGVGEGVVFGVDYFYYQDMPVELRAGREPYFLPEFDKATCYPTIMEELVGRYGNDFAQGVAWDRGLKFLKRITD